MSLNPMSMSNGPFGFLITGYPMPCSQNEAYRNISVRGRPGRSKSAAYRAFEQEAIIWGMKNALTMRALKEWVAAATKSHAIRIDTHFHFKRERIFCLDGSPKQNDTSNRIKCLHDVIARHAGLDDKWFWAGSFDKSVAAVEGVDISFRLVSLKARSIE